MAADSVDALGEREKVKQLLNAARIGNLDLLKKSAKQLDCEGKGLASTIADVKDANRRGALHFAACEGKTEICKYLLAELNLGDIVNVGDEEGDTPLIHAARQGHICTAKYLVEHGADPSISSEHGTNALHYAAGIGNLALIEFFLASGVDVDALSNTGTPLIWAAGGGYPEAVKLLLENCANPNAETDDNVTPLLSSVAAGSLACLELLVQDGFKPIQVAAGRGYKDAVEILFPVTSPIENVSHWTVDGIIEHEQHKGPSKDDMGERRQETGPNGDTFHNLHPLMVTPEVKVRVQEARSRGEEAFRRKDYHIAIDAYTQAIDLDPYEGTLLSNRSLCWIRLGQADYALADARSCRALRPDWPKAYYREGAALRLMQKFDEAASVFYEGIKLDPENKELVSAFRDAVEAGKKFHESGQLKIEDGA